MAFVSCDLNALLSFWTRLKNLFVFIAWGAMFTGIAGGVLMVCSAWSAQSEDDDEYEGGMNYAGKNDYTAGQMTMGGGAPGYV